MEDDAPWGTVRIHIFYRLYSIIIHYNSLLFPFIHLDSINENIINHGSNMVQVKDSRLLVILGLV